MKGKYKAALALLLLLILIPLQRYYSDSPQAVGFPLWGIWLPSRYPYRSGTKPTPDTSWVEVISITRYLVNDCSLAHIAGGTGASQPLLVAAGVKPQTGCRMHGRKLPTLREASPAAPRTLARSGGNA